VVLSESCDRFDKQLKEIKTSPINSLSCHTIIKNIEKEWQVFFECLETTEPHMAYENATALIGVINTLTKEYEKYAGE